MLTPNICSVTAKPSWLERLLGVRGYSERFAVSFDAIEGGICWLWDGTARRCEPAVAYEIEAEAARIEWRTHPAGGVR